MKLEFGIFDHLDRNGLPLREYYEQRLKVIEAFDRSGFYAYHVAEHHLNDFHDWDFIIHNDGTMDELKEKVKEIAKEIRKKNSL